MANVLGFFQKAMPFITTGLSLAGPAGNLAASLLSKIPALKVASPTIDGVMTALENAEMTPELSAQLQEAELAYKQQMQKMGFDHETDLAKIAADDRASARTMQIQTKSWITPALATLITVGFFGLLVLTMFHVAPAGSEKILDVMTGALGTAWISIVNYYFGSSAAHDTLTANLSTANGG